MAEFQEVINQMNRMCDDCDICKTNCEIKDFRGVNSCYSYVHSHPQQAEAIIMKWAEEHPVQTNADKFKEVFGYNIDIDTGCHRLEDCDGDCKNCELNNFWKQEYKEPKGVIE